MSSAASGVDLGTLRNEAERILESAPPGESLPARTRVLVEYAVRVSVTSLDLVAARDRAQQALDLGVTADQLHEVLVLVSGLGVHTLMEGSRQLLELIVERGGAVPTMDAGRSALRQRYVGTSTYWTRFEEHVPGFLDAILCLSPEAFEGFMAFGAIPAHTNQLEPVVREIISVAVDATPQHRYMPGLRLHLANALRLGAGRAELLEAIDVAAVAPDAPGVS